LHLQPGGSAVLPRRLFALTLRALQCERE
jgi:hypothetical protein